MRKIQRGLSGRIYIIAIIFAVSIFLLGLSVGIIFNNYVQYKFEEDKDLLEVHLTSLNLKDKLISSSEDICQFSLDQILEDKNELGDKISVLENKKGKHNREVLIQKEFYQLIEIKTLILLKEFKEKCNIEKDIILFFYTNDENDLLGNSYLSEEQGYILTNLYELNPDKFVIFSFDINAENDAVQTLMNIHDITKAPLTVIDKEMFDKYRNIGELKDLVGL
ncbi:hypothetical protein CL617_03910 [archaeon]|nr:hypothetical protein [archaeon]|tara:strand:+ start:17579 stop:18244 length:666 start_codon:yes stop_codon:yes gene_type:complete